MRAALEVFAESGVDAPVREIAARAGVGVGTVYRHFPQRADLVAAVFRHEVDACADAAEALSAGNPPAEAVALWLQRFAAFIATKRGLASALHSGDPAFDALPGYFEAKLVPAMDRLLRAAVEAGEMRGGIDPRELIMSVARLCMQAREDTPGQSQRMVGLLVDGLRFGAGSP